MTHLVYKIWSEKGDLVYYGSTTNLYNRKRDHKKKENITSSKYLINAYGFDNCKFDILEECKSFEEMRSRENWYIQNNPCVNIMSACYNPMQKKEYVLSHKKEKQEYDKKRRQTDENRHIRITCECGGSYTLRHKSTHDKTIKHQKLYVKEE